MLALVGLALAWSPSTLPSLPSRGRARPARCEFGDYYYAGAAEGSLPEGVYEVTLCRPLGIQFEEDGPNVGKNGVPVLSVVEGSNAAKDGTVKEGDKLVGVTGVRFVGAKWERQMVDARKMSFDTVVDAIGSNEEKFDCYDVILQLERKS